MQSDAAIRSQQARRAKNTAAARHITGQVLLYATIIILSAVFAMPLIWMVSTSLKYDTQVYIAPPEWIPNPIRWANYAEALTKKPFALYTFNTIKIALPQVIGTVISCSLVAYGFARIDFPGGTPSFLCVSQP